jgi:sulfate permease, SulP family
MADQGPRSRLTPGLDRMLRYERSWLRGDVVAGVTVAAYLVPQVMAYAEVAGLPPVAGLWAVVGSMTVYALLGSSRQLSVGPESTTALMTAVAIGPLAAGDPARYAALAAALALVVAVLCMVGWVARLGFLGELLSKPVLVGYLAGVAVIMIVSQLDTITGVEVEGSTPLQDIASFVGALPDVRLPTVLLSAAVLLGLLLGSRYFPRAPIPLIAILLAAAAVAWLDLDVAVIGEVPAGLPSPQVPVVDGGDLASLLLPAVGVTVVAFTDNTLTARAFATRGGYRVDANQELLALGGANLAAGLSQGFPVSSSGSRTVIGDSLGSRSQLYSLVAVATVLVTLFALGDLLAAFPSAALGALVVWAALRLIDLDELRRIARFRSSELVLALTTTVAVLVVDILYGVLVAVGLSVLDLLRRVARPHDGILGYAPGVAGMHDIDDYPGARQVPGLVVYRYDSPLFFANAEDFKRRALEAVDDAEQPVEWLLLNAEANVQVDLTSVDALDELREELEGRGIVLALARVKFDLREELSRAGFVDRVGDEHIFATLPTAVAAFVADYTARHGHAPPGIRPPEPPTAPLGAP